MILVDSNILIDVLESGQEWRNWSIDQLVTLAVTDRLVVNQIAFAEVAPGMGSPQAFAARLASFEIAVDHFGEDAAFIAGRAFLLYRSRRPPAKMVLPDFFIGGHAQVLGAIILTRDPRFYRAYFPDVPLITPESNP